VRDHIKKNPEFDSTYITMSPYDKAEQDIIEKSSVIKGKKYEIWCESKGIVK
jgi:hypothetical protein